VGGREGVSEEFSTRLGGLLTLVKGCIVGAFVGLRLGLREGCALGVTETEGNWDGMADGIFVLLGGLVTEPVVTGLVDGAKEMLGCDDGLVLGIMEGMSDGSLEGTFDRLGWPDGKADGIFVLLGGLVTAPIEMGLSEGSEDIVGCSENEGV